MKKLKNSLNIFVLGVVLILGVNCSKQETFMEEEITTSMTDDLEVSTSESILTKSEAVALTVLKKGTYKISESEAIRNLKHFSNSDSNGKGRNLRPTHIALKKNPKTGKEMYYEVTFESEKGTGFSILSADERVEEVLCYSEVGSISDTTFNKSLKFCLELVDLYVEEELNKELDLEALTVSARKKFVSLEDQAVPAEIQTKAIPPFNPDDPNSPWYPGRTDTKTTVSERLKFIQGVWHQESPFNDHLPNIAGTGIPAFVGCSMLSVTQIMSYHKKPFRGYVTTAMWPSMINNPDASTELKNLIRDVFNDMVIEYDNTGSFSNITKARNFLNNNGYTAGSAVNYTYNTVWDALNYGPTYIRGDMTRAGRMEGHAWIIDGARTTTTQLTEIYYCDYNGRIIEHSAGTTTYVTNLVKYDWGWGNPDDNVWFHSGVFQMPNGNNFNLNISMISYVR